MTDTDPEAYVREHREEIIQVIRRSDDSFTRACAWALLDRYSTNPDIDQLQREFDAVIKGDPQP